MAVDFKVQHQRSSEYLFAPEDIDIRAELLVRMAGGRAE